MFKHILIPADGSENAQRAIDKAIGLAQAFKCQVTAIYVIDLILRMAMPNT
jgi:nucleotide-binding universal stress UspA family protein